MLRSSNFIEYRLPIGGRYSPFPWDAVATGASGLFGLFGASENRKSVEATNRMNLRIARETNQAQADLAAMNNEAQLQMMRENNQWSADQALKMFDLENQYNSPGAQAGRLLDAGFNPAVAMGNGAMASSTGNIATPSAAGATFSPTMPNFVTPTMQAPPSVLLGAVDAIAGLAGAANQFAQAGKTNKEAKRVNDQIDAEIKSLLATANNQDASASYTKTKNLIEGEWLPKRFEAEVSSMFSQCYLSYLKGETEKADAQFKKFEAKLSELKGKRYEDETPIILQQARETVKLIQEMQVSERTEQQRNLASARASDAEAFFKQSLGKTENILRWDKKQEILENIKNGKFARVANMIDSYMKAAGYNQPIWNLGAQLADAFGNEISSWFGDDEPKVKEFVDWFKEQSK